MYTRIVVATDTTRPATAVTIASALGASLRALELVTVIPPGVPPGVGRNELERVAIEHGWLPAACTVLTGGLICFLLPQGLPQRPVNATYRRGSRTASCAIALEGFRRNRWTGC